MAQAIYNGPVLGVSDGSFILEKCFGTAGWIMEDTQGHHRVQGQAATPGPACSHCSYCSELFGLLCMVYHIIDICAQHDVQTGTVSLHCDGKEAVKFLEHKKMYI